MAEKELKCQSCTSHALSGRETARALLSSVSSLHIGEYTFHILLSFVNDERVTSVRFDLLLWFVALVGICNDSYLCDIVSSCAIGSFAIQNVPFQ